MGDVLNMILFEWVDSRIWYVYMVDFWLVRENVMLVYVRISMGMYMCCLKRVSYKRLCVNWCFLYEIFRIDKFMEIKGKVMVFREGEMNVMIILKC